MKGVKGYAGRFLRVNLNDGSLADEVFTEETLRSYIGGTGIGTKILYDEVPRGVEWSDSRNVVTIATGPLGGTNFRGSGGISLVTKGAMTGGATSTQANGLFGAYMKFSGYDGVIITGADEEWRYLVIKDGRAELLDASKLVGLDTYDVKDALHEEHEVKDRIASVLSIGPAGERLVRWAGTFVDYGHSASHNGSGTVLGSKKLKAIMAFRGSGRVEVHDPKRLLELSRRIYEERRHFEGTLGGVWRYWKAETGVLPVKNYSTYDWGVEEKIDDFSAEHIRESYEVKRAPCWGCGLYHCTMMEVKGKYVEEPEYEQLAAWGPVIGNTDVEAAIMLSGLTDRLGLDNNEAGWLIGWVMECMMKGYLTEEQVGLRTEFGDVNGAEKLLRMAAAREGFGDLLAEGVKRASQKIGGEAANMGIYTMKGNTPRGHDHRAFWSELFDTCVSNNSNIETQAGVISPDALGPRNPMIVSSEVARSKGLMTLEDSLVTCRFNTRSNIKWMTEALSAATGWDMTEEEALNVGRRIVNLMKAFNIQAGLGKELDRPSTRYGSAPVDGPVAGISIMPYWDGMLRNYYTVMGWDPETGVPLPETLMKLGLDHVAEDLKRARA